ncbi:MarR family transcriptional regulator [Photobacterium swingsii]|uniref:MarR family transcriptional regulator n=1 Tax=Photobacterium swingsii TaxID=680026 RepID=UPI00352EC3AD
MQNCAQITPINQCLASAARQFPHQVSLVKPSKTQLKVLNSIKRGELVTPADIADRCNLSSSFASTLLRRLHERTYLTRKSETCVTGGIIYSYRMHE